MHRHTRRRYLAAGVMVGLAILVIGTLDGILIASQSRGVSAAPILRPSSATGRVRASTATGLAPWLYMPPGFAGKVLHWSERSSFFEAGIADPSNGKVLLGDHWMALDAQGQPTAYFVRYTYLDGQLHQEIYQDRTTSIIVRGSDYLLPNQLVPPGWCITDVQTTFSALVGQYPLFANTAKLRQIAKDMGMQGLTLTPPSTARLPGAVPTAQEGNVSSIEVWKSNQVSPIDGSNTARQWSLGPLGRIVAQSTTGVKKGGSTALNAWSVYGPLDVYTRSAIPPTIFEVPQDLGNECA